MVKLADVNTANAALVRAQPLVAVFFGGTSGIGHYTLRALVNETTQHGKGLRAYLVGRKAEAAAEIISECRSLYSSGQYEFIKVDDLSLLRVVDEACADIIRREEAYGTEARIDYLMLSQGGSIFLPRKDTQEGLDVTMSLMYYSRMRTITNLLPLLLKSALPAHIISVYAGGMEKKLFPDDLSLRDLKIYSYAQARSHMVYMHTLFMETLAEQHCGTLSLSHIFPGIVMGPTFSSPSLPLWFRVIFNWIVVPLFGWAITVPEGECGRRMVSLAGARYPAKTIGECEGDSEGGKEGVAVGTDGKVGSGVYSLNWDGERNKIQKAYEGFDKEEMRRRVWEHTMTAFRVIELGGVFSD